ncbi:hypothetical protein K469DRAFT_697959 [Zopfia rhizophila CBS 207.26]|uniref:Uncharacterized protein n=1 Tax=Zopfia rhizophila CBS 207.26 TaxID=1314779 RepID=A0A6A6EFA7_9PEZI|nr:hypothetical protein K469DRAFT_697959 [Zopfia rhizophila CBS 207.26]
MTSKIRQGVETSLKGPSTKLADVEVYVALFTMQTNVADASFNLLVAILKALEEVIGYSIAHMCSRRFVIRVKGIKAFFLGDDYQTTLTESLQTISSTSQKLIYQANNSHIIAAYLTHLRTEQILECQNNSLKLFNEHSRHLQIELGKRDKNERRLKYDQVLADELLSYPQFEEWIIAPNSRGLLIHGKMKGILHVSAISLFCSNFIEKPKKMEQFRSIVFFCNRHLDSDDSYTGGRGLIKSVTAQILRQNVFNLGHIDGKLVPRSSRRVI